MTPRLSTALAAWRKLPATRRELVLAFFATEQEMSETWATQIGSTPQSRRNDSADAKAFAAALALLKAAERPAARRKAAR